MILKISEIADLDIIFCYINRSFSISCVLSYSRYFLWFASNLVLLRKITDYCTKTTIFKIGKPNYWFFENRIWQPLQKEFFWGSKLWHIFHFDLTQSLYTASLFIVRMFLQRMTEVQKNLHKLCKRPHFTSHAKVSFQHSFVFDLCPICHFLHIAHL